MRNIFKLVFLFVGVVIGAGFATGSEIMLYFSDNGIISVIVASFLMGILSIIFCYFGKIKQYSVIVNRLMKIVVFFSSFVTYCVMISGANEIIQMQYGIKYFGVLTGLIVAFLMFYDIKIIKLLNLVIVPLIIAIMLAILIKSGGSIDVDFDFSKSLRYAGMNMLLGGYFMSEEGDELSNKQILTIGVLVFLSMGFLMSICYAISMLAPANSMPIYEVARMFKMGDFACIVIYLAIFTTLIGSSRALADMLQSFGCNKILTFLMFSALGVYFAPLDFASLVEFIYGILGIIGMVICVLVTSRTLLNRFFANKKLY